MLYCTAGEGAIIATLLVIKKWDSRQLNTLSAGLINVRALKVLWKNYCTTYFCLHAAGQTHNTFCGRSQFTRRKLYPHLLKPKFGNYANRIYAWLHHFGIETNENRHQRISKKRFERNSFWSQKLEIQSNANHRCSPLMPSQQRTGRSWWSNPRLLAPKTRIIPLHHSAAKRTNRSQQLSQFVITMVKRKPSQYLLLWENHRYETHIFFETTIKTKLLPYPLPEENAGNKREGVLSLFHYLRDAPLKQGRDRVPNQNITVPNSARR